MQNMLVLMQFLQYYDFVDYLAHYEVSPRLNSHGLHAHDYYEFFFHIKGGRLYCVDDTVFELKPNQIVIIPPLHMHGLVCDRDLVDYERCWLYLTPESLNKFGFGKIDFIKIIDDAFTNQNFINIISENDSKIIIKNLQQIERNSSDCEKNSVNQIKDYLEIMEILEIAVKTFEEISKNTSVLISPNSSNSMQKVLHYINEHYIQDISIKDLCEKFNMSESALSHEFRKYTNKAVYEYILYKRIIRAKELLFTGLNFTQVSLECGFHDYSNFLRVFKKITGNSPKEYKNLFPDFK